MSQGKRRGIPNWDTFVGLNFSMADVRVIADAKLHAIPPGTHPPPLTRPILMYASSHLAARPFSPPLPAGEDMKSLSR